MLDAQLISSRCYCWDQTPAAELRFQLCACAIDIELGIYFHAIIFTIVVKIEYSGTPVLEITDLYLLSQSIISQTGTFKVNE